ncbi:DUF6382 domain-containing protein [bacterium 210820-DFI.6.37]|nr:DUF6382 domain-containing protein [bacterium 210820-DFI.6.37]
MEIRNNDFKLQLKEGSVREYEKIVLSSGLCDLFMPMGFVSSEEGEIVSYHCSGYAALRQCNVTETMEAFEILEKTFLLVSRAGEYLITPSKITLSVDTIFYNRQTKQVKIAYVPVTRQGANLRENMAGFMIQMENGVKGNGKAYLQKVRKEMEDNNYYIQDLINVIGEMRRKLAGSRGGEQQSQD